MDDAPRFMRQGCRREILGSVALHQASRDTSNCDFAIADFVQLDLRVDRTWRRPWGTIALYVDLQNVTNRLNPEGVTYDEDYSHLRYTRGLPIFPAIGVEYVP